MGLIYILLAAILNTVKGFCSKKVSGKLDCLADNIDLSLLRSVVCALLGALFLLANGVMPHLPAKGWLICIVAGASISVNYAAWVLALRTDAYMFASAASSSGFIVTVLGGILLFGETLTPAKGGAILLILLAMWFMLRYQKEFSGMPSAKNLLLLGAVFLTQGISQLSQKQFTRTLPEVSVHVYTFWAFVISAVLLLLFRLLMHYPGTRAAEAAKVKGLLVWIAVMGISLYGVTCFQAMASARMDAIVLYPLNNGLALLCGSIMAWAAFREKPSRNSIIGAILIFAALMLTRLQ